MYPSTQSIQESPGEVKEVSGPSRNKDHRLGKVRFVMVLG